MGEAGNTKRVGMYIGLLCVKISDTIEDEDHRDEEYRDQAEKVFSDLKDILIELNEDRIGAKEASILAKSKADTFFCGPLRDYILRNHPHFDISLPKYTIGRA